MLISDFLYFSRSEFCNNTVAIIKKHNGNNKKVKEKLFRLQKEKTGMYNVAAIVREQKITESYFS